MKVSELREALEGASEDAPVMVLDENDGIPRATKNVDVEDHDAETSTGGQTVWLVVEES